MLKHGLSGHSPLARRLSSLKVQMSRYLQYSRSPYYAVVASLPLLVIYELLLTLDGSLIRGGVRNMIDVWVRELLRSLGLSPFHVTLAMIFALILAIPTLRSRSEPLEGKYFWGMLLEAIVYGFLLSFTINIILNFFFSFFQVVLPGQLSHVLPMALPRDEGLVRGLALSLGAGLFEEFFFRVILLNVLLYLARLLLPETVSVVASIICAALFFSLAHHIGPLGEPLAAGPFLFRWVAGLLFTVLYYLRGFAITAYSHSFHNLFVFSGLFHIVG